MPADLAIRFERGQGVDKTKQLSFDDFIAHDEMHHEFVQSLGQVRMTMLLLYLCKDLPA